MKNTLFFCNTYYQLIVAIQMKLTIKKEEQVTVVLTDESRNAETICERLRQTQLFHKVFFLQTKNAKTKVNAKFKLQAIKNGLCGCLPEGMDPKAKYDELIGFNLDLPTHYLFAALVKNNPGIICNAMEEGLLSYGVEDPGSGLLSMLYKVRKCFGKKNLREEAKGFYCFNPAVYKGSKTALPVPKISRENARLGEVLETLFLQDAPVDPYKQRYIYLPCIYDIEGGEPIGELELAKKIAGEVGKENLLVKVHPRDDAKKYENAGLTVDKNSAVPWEVLCIHEDFSQHVFITTLSGSILNVSAFLANAPRSYYAYPLCDLTQNPLAQKFRKVIDGYVLECSELALNNIKILHNIEQLADKGDA